MRQSISILGSTGSIGTQAIAVCQKLGIKVLGLAAKKNVDLLVEQIIALKPKAVCIFDENYYDELMGKLDHINIDIDVKTGMNGLCEIASMQGIDCTLNAVVGMIGLQPTLAAIDAKIDVALANKETLVTGGEIVMKAAADNNVKILPIDSEHSAIFQALQGNNIAQVKTIILTASGGPFFGKSREELKNVSLAETLKHPNWNMGAKVTVDSATMMNKGLELMEACHLFGKSPDEVSIVVHRESVVHSLVEYKDNAVIAQLGVPDMKLPIQYALTYPDRFDCDVKPLSLIEYKTLSFDKPDIETFLCLKACIEAMRLGGLYPTIVNGANEQAVELFLEERISFLQIGELVYSALKNVVAVDFDGGLSLGSIMQTDKKAREFVFNLVEKMEA